MVARGSQAERAPAKCEGAGVAQATRTFRAMKTVLALMAKVSTAITTHITRSECRTSRCVGGRHQRGCLPARADHTLAALLPEMRTPRSSSHHRLTHLVWQRVWGLSPSCLQAPLLQLGEELAPDQGPGVGDKRQGPGSAEAAPPLPRAPGSAGDSHVHRPPPPTPAMHRHSHKHTHGHGRAHAGTHQSTVGSLL